MFTGVWFVSFCALVRCGRAIHSDVAPLSLIWFDVARYCSVWSDVVISHTANANPNYDTNPNLNPNPNPTAAPI